MIKVAIAGGAGYTAGELLRILLNHPEVELSYVASESHDGEPLSSVHGDLLWCDLTFSKIDFKKIDFLFLCMGHGKSQEYLESHNIPSSVKIIDLSNDFRLADDAGDFIYGLPELNREKIKRANHIANPGCFATSIELGLLPLAKSGNLPAEVTVVGITGSTGAGQKPTEETHFSNRLSNLSPYKVFTHQHLAEIEETLVKAGCGSDIAFVPVRGCHSRGILAEIVVRTELTLSELKALYKEYYESHPFVCLSDKAIYMKQVVNTNYCFLHLTKEGDKLLITSIIDTLVNGASGQAVQNMNLMAGLDEVCGLQLKANYF